MSMIFGVVLMSSLEDNSRMPSGTTLPQCSTRVLFSWRWAYLFRSYSFNLRSGWTDRRRNWRSSQPWCRLTVPGIGLYSTTQARKGPWDL